MNENHQWRGKWINGTPAIWAIESGITPPAPYIRKTFVLKTLPEKTIAWVCAPGWHELYVNGLKVDDRVLAPVVTQFEKHVSYICYDISELVRPGKNAVVALLGNGWYNCATKEVWRFVMASWRDTPKIRCDIVADGTTVAASDPTWKVHPSPVIFDQLRNGEKYDFNLEVPGFADPETDDSSWKNAEITNAAPGLLVEEDLEPCKIMKRLAPVNVITMSEICHTYDFGVNMTGWVEIELEHNPNGDEKQEVVITYGERIRFNGTVDNEDCGKFIKTGDFQTDRVYLRPGNRSVTWHPRFTYHGFQYVMVACWGNSKVKKVTACFIHNAFKQNGLFESSHSILNRLQAATVQSYLSNFTGIPTDCPHREKNGWTGDCQLAMETGLWNFDSIKAYKHFIQILVDSQRPSGQFPSIAPSSGWGFNCSGGPAWDSVIFETAWQLWRFYGDDSVIRIYYDAMKKYIEYCETMSLDHLVSFGLGDWCHPERNRMPSQEMISSCYYLLDTERLSVFASMLKRTDDANYLTALASEIRNAINRKYANGDGSYDKDEPTALAAALFFHLCAPEDEEKTVKRLVSVMRELKHEAMFGILGAKWVPRVLADHGYADDAFQTITQTELRGWGRWIKLGATSLWEDWNGISSLNHIMFGDISAWMYEYAAGLSPKMEHPGFREFRWNPNFISGLDFVKAKHRSPFGEIRCEWRRVSNGIDCSLEIPPNCSAEICLPGLHARKNAGIHSFQGRNGIFNKC